jgi:hypothetical protein
LKKNEENNREKRDETLVLLQNEDGSRENQLKEMKIRERKKGRRHEKKKTRGGYFSFVFRAIFMTKTTIFQTRRRK